MFQKISQFVGLIDKNVDEIFGLSSHWFLRFGTYRNNPQWDLHNQFIKSITINKGKKNTVQHASIDQRLYKDEEKTTC